MKEITKTLTAVGAFIGILVILILLFGSWGTVKAGNRGVVLRMGAVKMGDIKGEGFYTKTPWVESVVAMNVQQQKEQVSTEGASRDLQTVHAVVALNLSLQPDHCATVYQTIGVDYLNKVVAPTMQEGIKAVLAQYTAEELISKREVVREGIALLIAQKLNPLGIKTEALNIINFNFSESFNHAIEAKVTAEQNALAAKNKLEQVKYEAEQSVAKANGEAKAISIQAQAIQAQGGAAYIHLKAIEKWDGILPKVSAGVVPFIDLKQFSEAK